MVDKDAGELIADGAVDEGCNRAGVDTPGDAADHTFVPYFGTNAADGIVYKRFRGPRLGALTDIYDESAQKFLAEGSMRHLRMELNTIHLPARMGHGCHGCTRCDGQRLEARRRFQD